MTGRSGSGRFRLAARLAAFAVALGASAWTSSAPARPRLFAQQPAPRDARLDEFVHRVRGFYYADDFQALIDLTGQIRQAYPNPNPDQRKILDRLEWYRTRAESELRAARNPARKSYDPLAELRSEVRTPTPIPSPEPTPLPPNRAELFATHGIDPGRSGGALTDRLASLVALDTATGKAFVGALALFAFVVLALMILRKRKSKKMLEEMEAEEEARAAAGAFFSAGVAAPESTSRKPAPPDDDLFEPLVDLGPPPEAPAPERAEDDPFAEPDFSEATSRHEPDLPAIDDEDSLDFQPGDWETGAGAATERQAEPQAAERPPWEGRTAEYNPDLWAESLEALATPIETPKKDMTAAAESRLESTPAPERGETDPGLDLPAVELESTEAGNRPSSASDSEAESPMRISSSDDENAPDLEIHLPPDYEESTRSSWSSVGAPPIEDESDAIVLEPPIDVEVRAFQPDETVQLQPGESGAEDVTGDRSSDSPGASGSTHASPAYSHPSSVDPFDEARARGLEAFQQARWEEAVHHLAIAAAFRPEAADVKESLRRARRMRKEGN